MKLYHFLGGVYFALILLFTVAVFVIAGTFIESATQSHRYASLFTYSNPIFGLLLWGFFINILFAATRRWPFRIRHIPFLITHLGLLMILGGVLIKHYFGLQGSMHLIEGAASQEVYESGTYAVTIQPREAKAVHYPLAHSLLGKFQKEIARRDDGLSLQLADFFPHATEQLSNWVKDDYATINGLQPMRLQKELIPQGRAHFRDETIWNLYALQAVDVQEAITELYQQNSRVLITDRMTGNPLEGIFEVSIPFSSSQSVEGSKLVVTLENGSKAAVPLCGDLALQNLNLTTPYLGDLPVAVDIACKPSLAVIKDGNGDVHLTAFDVYGRLWSQFFPKTGLESLFVYEDGFGGYAVRAELPAKAFSRKEREQSAVDRLAAELRQVVSQKTTLSPPLQLLQHACIDVDFIDALVEFLVHWSRHNNWLYPAGSPLPSSLAAVFKRLPWKKISSRDYQACQWTVRLFEKIGPLLEKGGNPIAVLHRHNWPLLAALEESLSEEPEAILTRLTQQIFDATELLPPNSMASSLEDESPEAQAALLSAYLRAYGIHLHAIAPVQGEIHEEVVALETTVTPVHSPQPPSKKIEDNTPKISILASKGNRRQLISLLYDPRGMGLKWPILGGEYLASFNPLFKEIPFRIRLRQARQINYPNSSQPYSFEGDLIITDRRTGNKSETTISMNRVYETWDGYRFYLATMSPSEETAAKRVQIVVNRDPAKYWLTYPGAAVLSFGIVMLFLMRPYRKELK